MAKQTKKVDDAISEEIQDGEKIHAIPLSEISADLKWNTRRSLNTNTGNFDEFMQNIAQSGQDTPVIVRALPGGRRGKMTYSLVCGFRRFEAIRQIGKKSGDPDPVVKAVIRTLTESEARKLNMRENTAREDFTTADLTHGVAQLKKEEPTITSGAIAVTLGISQSYATQLLKFASKVKPEILEMWRDSQVPMTAEDGSTKMVPHEATFKQMDKLCEDANLDKQEEIYRTFPKEAKDKERGPDSWKNTVNTAAREVGEQFGRLVKLGAIKPLAGDFWEKYLGMLISIPDRAGRAKKEDGTEAKGEVTPAMKAEFYAKAAEAYATALVTDFVWPPVPKVKEEKVKKEKGEAASAN